MLSFPPAVRIWLALAPADLRKGFDALAELVRQHLRDDPLSGHVFVFRNRRGDRIKLLYWDTDRYVIVVIVRCSPSDPTHQKRKRPLHSIHDGTFPSSRSEAPDRFAPPTDPPSGRMPGSLDTGPPPRVAAPALVTGPEARPHPHRK